MNGLDKTGMYVILALNFQPSASKLTGKITITKGHFDHLDEPVNLIAKVLFGEGLRL